MAELSLPEKIVAIHESLDEKRIPHAFGGALALAYYAEPRATVDIDLNVCTPTERFPELWEALGPLGVEDNVDRTALARDGQCRVNWGRTPLDLFFSYDEIHRAMRREARQVPFGESELPILGPEHLLVCKAMFDRPKDWLDIEQMLVGAEHLRVDEVREWLSRMVGESDPRIDRIDELGKLRQA
jgi:hypothetical protein